jgi:hypothetical protein
MRKGELLNGKKWGKRLIYSKIVVARGRRQPRQWKEHLADGKRKRKGKRKTTSKTTKKGLL